jgi:hypothetical protein
VADARFLVVADARFLVVADARFLVVADARFLVVADARFLAVADARFLAVALLVVPDFGLTGIAFVFMDGFDVLKACYPLCNIIYMNCSKKNMQRNSTRVRGNSNIRKNGYSS